MVGHLAERSFKIGSWSFSIKRASQALPMSTSQGSNAYNGGTSFLTGLLPSAKFDYKRLAGDAWRNSIVAASIQWIGRNLPQAPPVVYQMQDDGTEVIVPGHPLTQLLKRPNPFYDGRTLRQATFLSLIAGKGNAYWWIKRANDGTPLELWYLPHFDCFPIWDQTSTTDNWITGYVYRNQGQYIRLENDAILHFRDGMDPYNPRLGLDPLDSASREIVTDNEHSGYTAALLKNMCMSPLLITPKDATQSFEETDQRELKSMFEESSTGDNRFRPIVLSGSMDVQKLSLTPNEMMLDTASDNAEARLCALIGVPAMLLGLKVGLEHSTYSNMEESRASAWQDGIIPRLELMNSECDTQLLPFFDPNPTLRTGADYRRIAALQEDRDNQYERVTAAVGGPWLTPNEARQEVGLEAIAGGDALYPPPSKGSPEDDSNGQGKPPAKPGSKKTLAEAVV
jgi:HK97 family phage portal protein